MPVKNLKIFERFSQIFLGLGDGDTCFQNLLVLHFHREREELKIYVRYLSGWNRRNDAPST